MQEIGSYNALERPQLYDPLQAFGFLAKLLVRFAISKSNIKLLLENFTY